MFNFAVGKVELISALVAKIAQVVEHFPRNEKVAGSSPAFGSKYKRIAGAILLCFYIEYFYKNKRQYIPFGKYGKGWVVVKFWGWRARKCC